MYVYIELKHWELERHHCVVNLLARMWRAYLGNFSSGHHAKPNTHGAFPVSDNMWLTTELQRFPSTSRTAISTPPLLKLIGYKQLPIANYAARYSAMIKIICCG